jgi:cyclopropane fatty-acyl-phospholipid synthase-like methyltransferase
MFWVLAIIVGCFGLGALFGAPFLPARQVDVEAALDLAEVKAGETVIDLGSGDGRLLLAAASRGAQAIGYEINPLMWLWSWLRTRRYRRKITVKLANFWLEPLPPADVIYTFLITRHVDRLDAKLKRELDKSTRVVSYVFDLPRQPVKQTRNTFLYRYP